MCFEWNSEQYARGKQGRERNKRWEKKTLLTNWRKRRVEEWGVGGVLEWRCHRDESFQTSSQNGVES